MTDAVSGCLSAIFDGWQICSGLHSAAMDGLSGTQQPSVESIALHGKTAVFDSRIRLSPIYKDPGTEPGGLVAGDHRYPQYRSIVEEYDEP